jgi:hypothetical protein
MKRIGKGGGEWGAQKDDLVIVLTKNMGTQRHGQTDYTASRKTTFSFENKEKKTKLRGLSPRANYTDRATAAFRRS